jgi:flagellar protein FlaG
MDINKVAPSIIENMGQSKSNVAKEQLQSKIRDEDNSGILENLTKENVQNIADSLNSAAKSVNTRVSFSVHEKTNRIIMKIQDSESGEVIREIPSKEMIKLLEHMHELIGMFVNESR